MDIVVPSFGESVTEASVAKVLVKNGDVVQSGAEIVELETDKVNQVVTAPASGSIQLQVKEGDIVSIGQSIGQISASDNASAPTSFISSAQESKENPGETMKAETESTATTLPEAMPQAHESAQTKSSSHSSRKTTDNFLDSLGGTETSSLKPAVQQKPLAEPQVTPAKESSKPKSEIARKPEVSETKTVSGEKRKKMTAFRMTIAKKLVEVKNQTAMLTTFNEVDMTEILAVRSKSQDSFVKKHGVKLGFTSFFVKACVQALETYKEINARIEGDEIVYPQSYNIGIAVSTDRGLAVPVLRECENLSFADIEKKLAELAKKAREFKLSMADLTGGTFTITNGGVFGSLLSTPILNPPQSAILGMHTIQKRVVVLDNEMVIRPMMYLALSYDHRIVDGKEAVGFLVEIKEKLEKPMRLALDF